MISIPMSHQHPDEVRLKTNLRKDMLSAMSL
jgi:hypothetical protein